MSLVVSVAAASADELGEKLQPFVGKSLDLVETSAGRRFVRPTLESIAERKGVTKSIRLKPENEQEAASLPIAGIVKIVAGRETIHHAEVKARTSAQIKEKKGREAYEKWLAASRERMKERGVRPWPALTAAEHAEEVKSLQQFVEEVRKDFPNLQATETHEFIVLTDIPAVQMAPYVASLDAMHDFLCDLYGIPRGEPVWKGKCLVVAFLQEQDYHAFEARHFRGEAQGTHGLCHSYSDGRVIMSCHRGDDAPAFAHMLVHETSHGFNHRWISALHLPSWLNEGIAEWVGMKVVQGSHVIPLKEAKALEAMQQTGTMGNDFFGSPRIESVQYGMASSMVKFLVAQDPKKFVEFVQGIKEGLPAEASLKRSFKASFDDLVKAYGTAVGLPNLKR